MDEVKMALDVPTVAALCEQHTATDDEWQMWYGRQLESDHDMLYSGIIDHTYDDESVTSQGGADDTPYVV